jgi:hypothetical protein
MKTKLLQKVKKSLKHFHVSVTEITEKGHIKVMATEFYNHNDYIFYGVEDWIYNKQDFEKWKKQKYFLFYRRCIIYYKSYYNLEFIRNKKILKKFGL